MFQNVKSSDDIETLSTQLIKREHTCIEDFEVLWEINVRLHTIERGQIYINGSDLSCNLSKKWKRYTGAAPKIKDMFIRSAAFDIVHGLS